MHLTARSFPCTTCDKTFTSSRNLRKHQNIHSGGRPFQCKFCDKTFTTPRKRDAHVKVKHCNSSDFKCPCGYSFPDQHKLKIHQEGCVLSKKGATVAIKRKFAELCANTEDRNAACTQAFSEIRAEAQTRLECRCSHCGVCFASKDSLKRHLRHVREKARSSTDPA